MIDAILRIRTSADWLIASSRGGGEADLHPVVDDRGFPIIPGRSLRGLLRAGMREASCLFDSSLEDAIFGREGVEGRLAVGDARLPAAIRSAIDSKQASIEDLFTIRRRTAIDPETGTARSGSLRAIEVTVPGLVLEASIQVTDAGDLPTLAFAASMVRRLGMGRSRGLGRCVMEILHGDEPVSRTRLQDTGGAA